MSGLEWLFAAPILAETASAAAAATTTAGIASGATASSTLVAAEAAATAAISAPAVFPWSTALSVVTSGGQLLSGISERMSVAAQRRAEARQIEERSRKAAMQEFRRGVEVTEKGRAIAAASGLDVSSGSPLAITIANMEQAAKNANIVYSEGQAQASSRRAEADQYDNPLALAGVGVSVLSDFVKRRYA